MMYQSNKSVRSAIHHCLICICCPFFYRTMNGQQTNYKWSKERVNTNQEQWKVELILGEIDNENQKGKRFDAVR